MYTECTISFLARMDASLYNKGKFDRNYWQKITQSHVEKSRGLAKGEII